MKLFKKIATVFLVSIILFLLGGYFYFQKKFTPPENYLNVSGVAENIPAKWISSNGNSHSALLLPVKIKGVNHTFYMQFDSGSPITVFYKKSLESIAAKFQNQLIIGNENSTISTAFTIGKMNISSDNFEVLNYGEKINFDDLKAVNIIGTIGTDLLEKRVTVLDFKNNQCSFIEKIKEDDFTDFEFKKRKILIPSVIENEKLKLLYDSGTSGYELITTKEIWQQYRNKNSKIKTEKGNSWGNTLSVYSASAKKKIQFGKITLNLSEVTYIEGTSDLQKFLMKRSGMQGMIGNKLFLNHKLILDCKNEKFKLE
ncbi:hypothetical protein [Flavobacterium nitrogenifigens]|uniref:Aspartyl protease n=1 Tax=Flavobacterium nitrogenifigens TaxID=1617283 RepID=A0A521EVF0_9FLAO|nr:hypothetical protein [Flavobacterium nitrogenifigens]KAF2333371.1 hypothetical protein DM397_09520 [Flavobacterium nitrogenifigens]SMO87889.1 hypothetical protein SAMN06265220_105148 [Flavobacterium nitrogenifigens]